MNNPVNARIHLAIAQWLEDAPRGVTTTREQDSEFRLITTILDPGRASADDLAETYTRRWEIEPCFDELKTHSMSDKSSTLCCMQTITKRELNQRTAAVLDQVTETDDLVVTERGKPRWRVSAVRDQDTVLARLEREGRYTPPASTPAPWPVHPGGPAYTETQVDALLDEMRGDH